MKPERTIQDLFDKHPASFCTRKGCLDHLFVVIGNGYEWHNGELVALDSHEVTIVEKEDVGIEYIISNDTKTDIVKAVHPWTNEDWDKHFEDKAESVREFIRSQIEKAKNEGVKDLYTRSLASVKVKRTPIPTDADPHKWYPISWEHSYIANLPDDITPEWKKLADECKALLLEDGIDVDNKIVKNQKSS